MRSRKFLALCVIVLLMTLTLSSCIPGDGTNAVNPAGFLWGIWHGWLAPISLIISIFNKDIKIYEIHNTGFWYDLGYYMAIISGFGGLTLSRRRRKKAASGTDES